MLCETDQLPPEATALSEAMDNGMPVRGVSHHCSIPTLRAREMAAAFCDCVDARRQLVVLGLQVTRQCWRLELAHAVHGLGLAA